MTPLNLAAAVERALYAGPQDSALALVQQHPDVTVITATPSRVLATRQARD